MVCSQTCEVSEAISRKDFEKAMSLRDPEFRDTFKGFIATATLETEKLLPESKVRSLFSVSFH
jgi:6-phosphofructokinase 1